ncbi:MAG TPA: hypothetical protein ENH82_09350 [bacterium]|nr:hypothetical protein [bacterium]
MINTSTGKIALFAALSLIVLQGFAADVLLFTYAYNRPDFIEIQYKTFKKFLKDDYEFIVFNDARDRGMEQRINNTCKQFGIRCIRIPQEIHERPYLKRWPGESKQAPAVRNCNVVMYSLNEVGFKHDGIVALFDSDLFLVRDFSISEYTKGYDLAGLPQPRPEITYLWIGLAFLDMRSMPNKTTIDFNCGRVGNQPVDAGGHTHYYLKNNPQLRVDFFDKNFMKGFHFIDGQTRSVNLEDGNVFLHYYAGTNWTNYAASYHNHKTIVLNQFIDRILSDK